jgi:L-alanine-DL-glutamate epimerase-like enolase superfamily enzyme
VKVTDVRTALLGNNLIVRLTTDEDICGYGAVEATREFVRPAIEQLAQYVVGENPTEVERIMLKIRRLGAFKPWGKAVSAVEVALWDLAGKAAGLPIHRLLGGKVRDRVRVYNGGVHYPGDTLAERIANFKAGPEGFTMMKAGAAYHGGMARVPGFTYAELRDGWAYSTRGPLT